MAYAYDDANRVISIAYAKADGTPIETVSYAYDPAGQRIMKALGSSSVQETGFNAAYDAANRLTSITLNGESFTLSYDGNGNLVSKSGPVSGTTAYTWDAKNRLGQIAGQGLVASFRYDASGRRVERTVNGVTTGYLYDGAQAIAELRSNAIDTVYHTGLQIDEVLARYAPSGNKTLLTDALNSVIAQAGDDQSVENFYGYSPYGQVSTLGSDDGNSLQYTGRENDQTGLYFYRGRYYDPVLKRFISEDPIGIAGGLNLYAYVKNNPMLFADPKGEAGSPAGAVAATAIAALMASLCVANQCDAIARGVGGGARRPDAAIGDCISELNRYQQTHPGELEALQAFGISIGTIAGECGSICSRLTSEPSFRPSCEKLRGCSDDGTPSG